VGLTRYYSERMGVTVDGRGYYGTAYVYNNGVTNSAITNPAISQYAALIGPTYRFYLQPKYSISGRVLGGSHTELFRRHKPQHDPVDRPWALAEWICLCSERQHSRGI